MCVSVDHPQHYASPLFYPIEKLIKISAKIEWPDFLFHLNFFYLVLSCLGTKKSVSVVFYTRRMEDLPFPPKIKTWQNKR